MALWKRLALISASFGVGVVIAIAALWGGVSWYEGHRAWDTNALKATFATMEFDTQPAQDSYAMKFFYDVENNTSKNYQINPDGFTVMAYLSEGNVLSKEAGTYETSGITVEGPPFIPPKGKARITLRTTYQYPSEFTATEKDDAKKVLKSVNLRLQELNGFVLFDQQNHYRIELPKDSSDAPKSEIEPPTAPDRGDRVAACHEAHRMVSICKANNIGPFKTTVGGWFDVPLPQLAKQATDDFVPAPKSCDTAFQWQNYCNLKNTGK